MLINSRVQYALVIIYALKSIEEGNILSLQDINKKYGISINFLEQVARDLRIAGLIKSKKGPGGGYFLENKNLIPLSEVLNAVKHTDIKIATKDSSGNSLINSIHTSVINKLSEVYV